MDVDIFAAGGGPARELVHVPVVDLFPGDVPMRPKVQNFVADDPGAAQRGMEYFDQMNCVGCHAPNGGGGMGPSLSNAPFIYGSAPANIYLSILQGRAKGMPIFGGPSAAAPSASGAWHRSRASARGRWSADAMRPASGPGSPRSATRSRGRSNRADGVGLVPHTIPGIERARGLVGPPPDHMGERIFIAGLLRNTPANITTWLRDPQEIVPGNATPDMGLSDEQARDIAAYPYTLN